MKILILTNHQVGLYKFRREMLERLVAMDNIVYVSVPLGDFTDELKTIGIKLIDNQYLDRRGSNPLQDIKLIIHYKYLLRKIKPDLVLTYTVKPNVYGGYVCGRFGVPYIANVTGLGTAIQNGGIMQKIVLNLSRVGLKKASTVFFQNTANRDFMIDHHVLKKDKAHILMGSGVNIFEHRYEPYPDNDERVVFTTIGRVMKDKGIDELLEAAEKIRKDHPEVEFRLIGDIDGYFEEKVASYEQQGFINFLGFQRNVHRYIADSHAIIHPSYHEGMSNVLQEAAATGRPVIATDIAGCIETYEPDVTGIAFKPKDVDSLVKAIERFLTLSHDERENMGRCGREKMLREFNRQIVIDKYIDAISDAKKM